MVNVPHTPDPVSGATEIVLLHGVGLDRTMWEPLQALAEREMIAIDLPGHGAEPPLRAPQSLAAMADDVVHRLPEGASHLVGFSLGALLAQHIARFHPDRVASLTSVSAVCERTPFEAEAVASRLAIAQSGFSNSVTSSLRRWYPPGTSVSPEVIAATERVLSGNDVTSYLHAYAVFANGDQEIAPELGRIAARSLVITGELDSGSTPDMARRLADAIPNSRLVVVPGARHMLPVEDSRALLGALTDFIDDPKENRD
ncbi:alpha/beta fold hydrolase [Mycetocola sp.]|uniref:alpha/beta fold hydrolase n=1 Tax=Mycetocola sp. TaxID=1871042 RepID=UPI00398A18F6